MLILRKKFFFKHSSRFEILSISVFGALSILWIPLTVFTFLSFSRVISARLFSPEYGGILPEDYIQITLYDFYVSGILHITAGVILLFIIPAITYMKSFREVQYSTFWLVYNYLLRAIAIVTSILFMINGFLMIFKPGVFVEYYYRALNALYTEPYPKGLYKAIVFFERGRRLLLSSLGPFLFAVSVCFAFFGFLVSLYLTNWGDENGIIGGVLLGIGSLFLVAISMFFLSFLATLGLVLLAVGFINVYKYETKVDRMIKEIEQKVSKIFKKPKPTLRQITEF